MPSVETAPKSGDACLPKKLKEEIRVHLKKKLLSALLSASLLLSAAVGPMQAAAATEEEGNLAYGKTVTVSAGGTETHLDFVTDGVIADGWEYSYMHRTAAEAEDTSDKTYLTIDLGGSYSIDRIRYIGAMPADAGYYNTSHNMVIRISNDPNFEDESTRTVFNTDAGNYFGFGAGTDEEQVNSAEGIMVEFEAAEARYVRYYQHGASTVPTPGENCWPNALTACEIEVYAAGAETPPIDLVPQGNLAYGATVTGSEFNSAGVNTGGWWGGYDRNDLAEMAGGSINTDYWKAPRTNQGGETGEAVYVLFDLEEVQTLNNVKIWNYFKTT